MKAENVRDLLEQEMKRSKSYTNCNFGQPVGEGYPQMAQEVLTSPDLCTLLFTSSFKLMMVLPDRLKEELKSKDMTAMVSVIPEIYEVPASLLFWGIKIGRKMQQQEDAVLASLSAE